jgi:hypothetical protein
LGRKKSSRQISVAPDLAARKNKAMRFMTFAIFVLLEMGTTVLADDSAMKQFYGCYGVIRFDGRDSYSDFRPQTLTIEHSNNGPYLNTNGLRFTGTQFKFCAHSGPGELCQSLFAYEESGYCGSVGKGGDFFLFAGEACDVINGGSSCGGHIETVEVVKANGELRLKGSRIFHYPVLSSQTRGSLTAVVIPKPLNADRTCTP